MASNSCISQIPIWLDCDPGHDDAFALLLAAHHPSLNLIGVSTVHGNGSLANTTNNAASLLEAIGRPDIPIYPGATKPFRRDAVHSENIHGLSGLDGTNLLPIPTTPPLHDKNAFVAMKDALLSQPKDTAWLVATGTLTNVAILFAAFPEVALHIRGLSIMGGAVGNGFTKVPISLKPGDSSRIGNITPWAEFNIYCDPESAQSIFSSPVLAPKTTLITLDLTHQVLATLDIQSLVLGGEASSDAEGKGFPSILRQILHALLIFFANTYDTVFGISAGPPLHDPLAVAVLLSNLNTDQANHMIGAGDVIKFDDGEGRRYNVNVVTDGQHSKDHDLGSQVGRIIATPVSNLEGTGGVTIPCSVDVNKFWAMIVSCLERADSWNLTRSQAK